MTDDIYTLAEEMRLQDNRATSHPMFCVEEERTVYGLDDEFADDIVWTRDGEELGEDESAALEKQYDEDFCCEVEDEDGTTATRVGVKRHWELVTAFFTMSGAEAYVARNKHRHGKLRVYIQSGYRNDEWQMVREHLLSLYRSAKEETP